jgi:membrane protease subunit (stomatin/prohibitin family)
MEQRTLVRSGQEMQLLNNDQIMRIFEEGEYEFATFEATQHAFTFKVKSYMGHLELHRDMTFNNGISRSATRTNGEQARENLFILTQLVRFDFIDKPIPKKIPS